MGRLGGGDLRLKGRRQARLGRVLPEEPHEDLHRLGQRCAVLPYSARKDAEGNEKPRPNLLASNITKYYQLFEKLTPEAAENIAYNNAQKLYFDGWDVPSGAEPGTYARMPSYYDTECLDPREGKFVKGATDLDDDGKY